MGLVLMPHGLMDVAPPSMSEVRQFITSLRPCVTLTHALVTEGKVSEAAYHEALRTGMTHFNKKTGKFEVKGRYQNV